MTTNYLQTLDTLRKVQKDYLGITLENTDFLAVLKEAKRIETINDFSSNCFYDGLTYKSFEECVFSIIVDNLFHDYKCYNTMYYDIDFKLLEDKEEDFISNAYTQFEYMVLKNACE